MEIEFMGTRIGKLMWILIKISIMGLIMAKIMLVLYALFFSLRPLRLRGESIF